MTWIGTAGWSVPKQSASALPAQGSHLERYAARFHAVEINSSFYAPHRPATYARWAAATPDGFRFAVKAPREITHRLRLVGADEPLRRFLDESAALGEKRGPILLQLPPSLRFEREAATSFLAKLREDFSGEIVCEPRHGSWFAEAPELLLSSLQIARVAADPARAPGAGDFGGWRKLAYLRLHGSPKIHYSSYAPDRLAAAAEMLRAAQSSGAQTWCVFDNTALGAAVPDALDLETLLAQEQDAPRR